MKKILPVLALFFWLFVFKVQGQTTANVSGASGLVGGISHSYSIGEMALVHTSSTTHIIVTQGVLQPINTIMGVAESFINDLELRVYPIPTYDLLNIQSNFQNRGKLSVQLYDISGRQLIHKMWMLQEGAALNQIDLAPYASGNYFLMLQYENNEKPYFQVFKVQKLK